MPVWLETVDLADVFHNEALSFEERRDAIVQRLRDHDWVKLSEGSWLCDVLVPELAEAEDVETFDHWWSDLYDIADIDRVWIKTF